LLANTIVEVVADTALLAVADFENLTLKAFAFGDITRDPSTSTTLPPRSMSRVLISTLIR